mmetsp:Transcript_27935/g.61529  ORF Transcript_27935/g.61529 Transcript_27935/m.61529 type:complete len:562 (-) Transcript_27935:785-2470(-)
MIVICPIFARIIAWTLVLWGHRVDSFPLINLKGDPFRSTSSQSQRIRRLAVSRSEEETNTIHSPRSHRINFVSPLLDYGYPPAVKDFEVRQKKRQQILKSDDRIPEIIDDDDNEGKPILLYLPGFDGTYICPFIQFPELGTEFEIWCMTIGMEDRSTYDELKTVVLDFLKTDFAISDDKQLVSSSVSARSNVDETAMVQDKNSSPDGIGMFAGFFGGNAKKSKEKKSGRPIYIAGESFGGILASDVALTLLAEQKENKDIDDEVLVNLQGLVLINPATCYDRSQLATAGPSVANTPFPFYILGLFSKLVPLFTDEFSFEQLLLILQAKALPSVIDNPCREAYMGRVAFSLPTKLEFMPPSTLSWRLNEWLQTGCAALRKSSFAAFPDFRSLIVVGEKDKTLPSIAEAERLANKVMNLSRMHIHVVDGAGHASTCGSRLDLTAVIRYCFPELQEPAAVVRRKRALQFPSREKETNDFMDSAQASDDVHTKRTRMKSQAAKGVGPNFGMEERYDKADIGLNPLLYWSKSNYKAVRQESQQRSIRVPSSPSSTHYQKSVYTVSD